MKQPSDQMLNARAWKNAWTVLGHVHTYQSHLVFPFVLRGTVSKIFRSIVTGEGVVHTPGL